MELVWSLVYENKFRQTGEEDLETISYLSLKRILTVIWTAIAQ